MTSANIPTLNMSPYTLLSSLQPQTSQPDIKTPTLATPIGQSMFSFDDQKTGGLSPNFLSLNAFGNLSSSSLLNGLTVTSPIASGSNGATVQLNNYGNNTSNNNIINVSNLINSTQTPTMNRPLVPDGQSGLLPNVTHTPLIMDAMKAYNSLFPTQVSTSQQVPTLVSGSGNNNGGSLANRNTTTSTTGNNGTNTMNTAMMGMSPLTESFSDFKIETGQGQNGSQVIPTSMIGLPSQQVMPLDILSTSDPTLFDLSRERSMPEGLTTIPDGLFRGESVVSTVSQGNAHFVPSFYMEEPQVSDGGLGTSPTSARGSGPTLQFAMQMGQQMPMNNIHTNGHSNHNGGNIMNGMPAVPGFPPMTMLNGGYDMNGMPALDNNGMVKPYGQDYWQQMPFQVPMSQSQYTSVDLTMGNNGMGMGMGMSTMDPSNLYSMGSYGTTMTNTDNGMPSQISGNEYNPDMDQPAPMMGGRRRPKHSGGASRGGNNGGSERGERNNNNNGRRRGRNMPSTNTSMNESGEPASSSGNRGGNNGGGNGGARNEMTNFERDNISLMDLVKNELIEKCARDQHGSRFIQRALETATLTEKTAVFKQIEKCALGLCEDVFGNYVIQKFFEHGTDNHKITLAKILIGRVLPLTKSMYGCRVIQKALESVEKNMRIALVSELDGHVEECVRDQNGNHVIQKAIEEVPPEHLDFIVKTFDGKVYDFSTHPYGCRVIQRLLERCTPKQKESLLKEILKQVSTLSKDQYGNYVVQHMLQHGTPEAREAIIQIVATNIVAMSRQKFSSNVVEKLFANASEEEKDYLIENIMGFHSEAPPIVQMVRDQYGNYVIQKILEVASQQQRNRLINRIFELVPNLRKLMFGKHIINKIESITGNQYK